MASRADVLLMTLPNVDRGYKYRQSSAPVLALGYLQAYLERSGLKCKAINFFGDPEVSTLEDAVAALRDYEVPILGVSAQDVEIYLLIEFAEMVKREMPHTPLVVGGFVGYAYEELLRESPVDFVVVGEGELTVPELVAAILAGRDVQGTPGVAYRKGGEVVYSGPREQFMELDELLFPDLDAAPPYEISPDGAGLGLSVFSSRGCFFMGCSFCTVGLMHAKYRMMSPQRVADEIAHACARYPAMRQINFNDDTFDIGRLPEILSCLDHRGVTDLQFSFQTVARNILRHRDLLQDADFARRIFCIGIGIESFHDDQLREYNKRTTAQENWEATELCNASSISFDPFMIVDRTPERVQSTLDRLSHPIFWPYWRDVTPLFVDPRSPMGRDGQQHAHRAKRRLSISARQYLNQLEAVIRDHGPERLAALRQDGVQSERTRKIFGRYGIQPWQQGFAVAMNVLFDQRERFLDAMAELRARQQVAVESLQVPELLPPGEAERLEATVQWCEHGIQAVSGIVRHHIERSLFLGRIIEAGALDVFSLEFMLARADLRRGLRQVLEQLAGEGLVGVAESD